MVTNLLNALGLAGLVWLGMFTASLVAFKVTSIFHQIGKEGWIASALFAFIPAFFTFLAVV